jgi:TIR domain
MNEKYQYEIAFSFAGEDRKYVDQVARILRNSSINVFYDAFEQTNLWGKDLYAHLDDVYRHRARYCVMFISQAYKNKLWTNHERESAQARAFKEHQDYILPARFDDTEIPGIRPTLGYIDLRGCTPRELAKLIKEKLKGTGDRKTHRRVVGTRASLSRTKAKGKKKISAPSQVNKVAHRPKSQNTSKNATATPKPRTKTVSFNKSGIDMLPNDYPVVYKILTEAGNNNFTGTAKRGEVQSSILKHLSAGKNYVPGSKVQIERLNRFSDAQAKAGRIIKRTQPKYN